MRDPDLAEPEALGEVGDGVHLLIGDVAGWHAGRLGRQGDDRVAGALVRRDVVPHPGVEGRVGQALAGEKVGLVVEVGVRMGDETRLDAFDFLVGDRTRPVTQVLPLRVHLGPELLRRHRTHEDLDSRLVLVVATAVAVVDPQDCLEVGQQVVFGQSFANQAADDRCATQAAAHEEVEAWPAVVSGADVDADIVNVDCGTIRLRRVDGDLELAWQPVELGMVGGPLPHEFAVGSRVDDLVGRDAGELVGGDVPDATAAGLDAVHLHAGEIGQDVRHDLEFGPVDLDVLPRRQVGVPLVVSSRNLGQGPQLCRRQQPVGNGDAQHGCQALDVETVAQAQLKELIVRQFTGEVALGLIPVLFDPLLDETLVERVVLVHGGRLAKRQPLGF